MCSKCIPQVQECSNCIPQTHSKCIPIKLLYSQVYSQEDMHSELAVQFGAGLRQFANTSWIQCWFWTMFQGTFWRYKLNTTGIQNKSYYWLPIYGWSGSCNDRETMMNQWSYIPFVANPRTKWRFSSLGFSEGFSIAVPSFWMVGTSQLPRRWRMLSGSKAWYDCGFLIFIPEFMWENHRFQHPGSIPRNLPSPWSRAIPISKPFPPRKAESQAAPCAATSASTRRGCISVSPEAFNQPYKGDHQESMARSCPHWGHSLGLNSHKT